MLRIFEVLILLEGLQPGKSLGNWEKYNFGHKFHELLFLRVKTSFEFETRIWKDVKINKYRLSKYDYLFKFSSIYFISVILLIIYRYLNPPQEITKWQQHLDISIF